MEQPPHPMLLGDDEVDYYRGDFSPRGGSPRESEA
jgi:NADH-quinone oxidoreductase subunit I